MNLNIRKNLVTNEFVLYQIIDGESYDIMSFKDKANAEIVKEIIEKDRKGV